MKTPIKLQFVYIDHEWSSQWNKETLILCNNYMNKTLQNKNQCTLILRKTPAKGFQQVKLWAVLIVDKFVWSHNQTKNANCFLGSSIDHFLTNLAAKKTELTLYFKFEQETTSTPSPL